MTIVILRDSYGKTHSILQSITESKINARFVCSDHDLKRDEWAEYWEVIRDKSAEDWEEFAEKWEKYLKVIEGEKIKDD